MADKSHAEVLLVLQSAAGQRVVVRHSPYRLGRHADNDLTLSSSDVSAFHAELVFHGGGWQVVDRGSTNGTFVNGERVVDPTPLRQGDTIHLGNTSFAVASATAAQQPIAATAALSTEHSAIELLRLLSSRATYPFFQPLIALETRETLGWEALGRAKSPSGLGPAPLLDLAEKHDMARALGDAFARAARECAACRHCWPEADGDERPLLFFNVHPEQIGDHKLPQLMEELAIAELARWYRPVIEFPEDLACRTEQMARWVARLRDLDLLVAYDDFGQGQSRIADLLQVPPDYLKLDRCLVTELHAQPPQQTLVRAIVEACRTLAVKTVAEGIETEAEQQACREAGIDIGQGYLLARPAPAYQLFAASTGTLPQDCPFVRLQLL